MFTGMKLAAALVLGLGLALPALAADRDVAATRGGWRQQSQGGDSRRLERDGRSDDGRRSDAQPTVYRGDQRSDRDGDGRSDNGSNRGRDGRGDYRSDRDRDGRSDNHYDRDRDGRGDHRNDSRDGRYDSYRGSSGTRVSVSVGSGYGYYGSGGYYAARSYAPSYYYGGGYSVVDDCAPVAYCPPTYYAPPVCYSPPVYYPRPCYGYSPGLRIGVVLPHFGFSFRGRF